VRAGAAVAELSRQRGLARRRLGTAAETVVADYLEVEGFSIVGQNVRVGRLELDIVARDGSLVVIVEVRTRGAGSYAGAFESVDARKRQRILRAADTLWRTQLRDVEGVERLRLDVAAVTFAADRVDVEYAEGALAA